MEKFAPVRFETGHPMLLGGLRRHPAWRDMRSKMQRPRMNCAAMAVCFIAIAGCATQRTSESDFSRNLISINEGLQPAASVKDPSVSQFDSHEHCQATLVTKWSDAARRRRSLNLAETLTQIDFANAVKSVQFVEAYEVKHETTIDRWEQHIRLYFFDEVRIVNRVVPLGSDKEQLDDRMQDFIPLSLAQSMSRADGDRLVAKIDGLVSLCRRDNPAIKRKTQ